MTLSSRPRGPLSFLSAAVLVAALSASCAQIPDDPTGASGGDVERIELALTAIPTGTLCVRFTAIAGGRTFEQKFDVAGAMSLTASMQGLPVSQALNVSADAFSVACGSVTS